jgi:hypothetical protein
VYRLTDLDRHGNVVLTGLADVIVERFRDAPPVMGASIRRSRSALANGS